MPVLARFLLGSRRRLVAAIVTFVALDLLVLVFNLWIAAQVADDAVAINLAGRQRMLSQQTTKAVLLVHDAESVAARDEAVAELRAAFGLFVTTLDAFDAGGLTRGGDGRELRLPRVSIAAGRAPLERARARVAPLRERLGPVVAGAPLGDADQRWAVAYLREHNRAVLADMNELTFALERHSVDRIAILRAIQSGAFVLALGNFLAIVASLLRESRRAEQDGQRWRQMAELDPLTGLHNRRSFQVAAGEAIAAAERGQKRLAILVLDLDHFKSVNDTYGHAAGDELLRRAAEVVRSVARASDIAARLGGDEFALLCPDLGTSEAALRLGERLLEAFAAAGGPAAGPLGLRASVGVARFPEHGTTAEELMVAADRAMYEGKRAGGACCVLATLNR